MPSGDETERKRELWGEEGEVEERAVRRKEVRRKEVHGGGMVGAISPLPSCLGLRAKKFQARSLQCLLGCKGLVCSPPALSFPRAYLYQVAHYLGHLLIPACPASAVLVIWLMAAHFPNSASKSGERPCIR